MLSGFTIKVSGVRFQCSGITILGESLAFLFFLPDTRHLKPETQNAGNQNPEV
jgi:hypothetical protein